MTMRTYSLRVGGIVQGRGNVLNELPFLDIFASDSPVPDRHRSEHDAIYKGWIAGIAAVAG